jgi:hypothetical protein
VADHSTDAGRLGIVERFDSGVVTWMTDDDARQERRRRARQRWEDRGRPGEWDDGPFAGQVAMAAITLSHPLPSFRPPDPDHRLPASCPWHGIGSVSLRDVVGKRGSVILNLDTATA